MQTLARVWCALDMASAAGWGGGDAGADLTVLGHAGGFGRKGMCRTAGLGARVLADELSPPRHLVTSFLVIPSWVRDPCQLLIGKAGASHACCKPPANILLTLHHACLEISSEVECVACRVDRSAAAVCTAWPVVGRGECDYKLLEGHVNKRGLKQSVINACWLVYPARCQALSYQRLPLPLSSSDPSDRPCRAGNV